MAIEVKEFDSIVFSYNDCHKLTFLGIPEDANLLGDGSDLFLLLYKGQHSFS